MLKQRVIYWQWISFALFLLLRHWQVVWGESDSEEKKLWGQLINSAKRKKRRSCSVNVLGGLGSVLINHSAPRAFPQPLRGSRFVDSLCLIVLMRPRFLSSSISLIFFFVLLLLQAFIYVIQGHSIFLKQAINNLNIGATLKGRIRLSGAYYGTNNFVIKESIAGTS